MVAGLDAVDLERAVDDNLRSLGLDVLDVVNLRVMFDAHGPADESIEAPLTALAGRSAMPMRTKTFTTSHAATGIRAMSLSSVIG